MDQEFMKNCFILILLLGWIKTIIGYHFPWEYGMKAKRKVQAKLDSLLFTNKIDALDYKQLSENLDKML